MTMKGTTFKQDFRFWGFPSTVLYLVKVEKINRFEYTLQAKYTSMTKQCLIHCTLESAGHEEYMYLPV